MYKISTNIENNNLLDKKIINSLTFIEYIQFIIVTDYIFPIKNEFNYYVPFFLFLYLHGNFER